LKKQESPAFRRERRQIAKIDKPVAADRSPLVIGTDFTDDEAWKAVGTAIRQPSEDDFLACVEFLDEPDTLAGLALPRKCRPGI
jgi:hypothetical protein